MHSDARTCLTSTCWLITFPGVAISLTVLGMHLFGGMRDALAPTMSRSAGGMLLQRR